jgi:hypothetical protein
MRKSLGVMYIQRLPARPPASGSTNVITNAPPPLVLLSHSVIRMCACVSIVVSGYPMLHYSIVEAKHLAHIQLPACV